MRLRYPANIRIIRVPCTGKVDILHLLRAFERGADGVYVVGCMEGNCHFNSGNLRAKKRVERTRSILESIGIEGARIQMYNLSSSEASKFVGFALEMTEKIRNLGPNPIRLNRTRNAVAAEALPQI